jgi:hypothetical protein
LRDFLQHGAAPFHGISRVGGLLGRFAAPVKRAIITWDPWFFRRFSLPECEKIAQSAVSSERCKEDFNLLSSWRDRLLPGMSERWLLQFGG